MNVLITGAFGRLGLMCIEQALIQGYTVRAFDLKTEHNLKLAQALKQQHSDLQVVFGDFADTSKYAELLYNIDAVIHNIAILPPLSEDNETLATKINIDCCKAFIDAAQEKTQAPLFIFPSSVTCFGLPVSTELKKANDELRPSDNYTHSKVKIEHYLQTSSLKSVIMRVGVSVDSRTLSTERKMFAKLFAVAADNPVEWVHPKDVALAMINAIGTTQAHGKTFLLGGGHDCLVTQHAFLNAAFEALGLSLPRSLFQDGQYYTHWMDTSESERILQFQKTRFSDYKAEMAARLKWPRMLLKPLSVLINPLLKPILRAL